MRKIGVFLCHCGSNISGMVNIEKLAEEVDKIPEAFIVRDNSYICSSTGQLMIQKCIDENNLQGIVIGACSPKQHEKTFQDTLRKTSLNPYRMEIANLREHVSWCTGDIEEATAKALDLITMKVKKITRGESLYDSVTPVVSKALVIGGGIAGITAALNIASSGIEVILVERESSIGGHMARLDKTFPTLDCSACILTPRMVDAVNHPLITLHTYSEISRISGFVGQFTVQIRKKPRYIDAEKCTGCGICLESCPVKVPSAFEEGLSHRGAIYRNFPQSIPNVPVIDGENCLKLKKGKCGLCKKNCPAGCIDFDQKEEIIEVSAGAIITATGFSLLDPSKNSEYGYSRYPDVISSLQFERLINSAGPTKGKLLRPSDGRVPQKVAFIHCTGSREPARGVSYCSKFCCMAAVKQAVITRSKIPDADIYSFYIDLRASGKSYEEFFNRAQQEERITFIKGRVSRIIEDGNTLTLKAEDINLGRPIELQADLVVLADGITSAQEADSIARLLGIGYDKYGFMNDRHAKLHPVETSKAGVFLAGTCHGPKDIPETVAHASASAVKAVELLSKKEISKSPLTAYIDPGACSGCMRCASSCYYSAIEETLNRGKKAAVINKALCQGCGNCSALCLSGAIELYNATDEQIYNEITSLIY